MPDGYVTIATYHGQVDADLARLRLESEGVDVYMADQQTSGVNPFYGLAVGVRLQVPEEQADHAGEILAAAPDDEGEQALAEMFGVDPEDEERNREEFSRRLEACPSCGSERIERAASYTGLLRLLSIAILMFAPRATHRWSCLRCGREWKAP